MSVCIIYTKKEHLALFVASLSVECDIILANRRHPPLSRCRQELMSVYIEFRKTLNEENTVGHITN